MFLYDLVPPQELLGFVRGVVFPEFILGQYLPDLPIDDLEYRFLRGDLLDDDMAAFRSFDAEAPIGKRQINLARVTGEIPPLSKKIRLGEEVRLRLRSLQSGESTGIVAQVFDDTYHLARGLAARLELARAECLYNGTLTINENGVSLEADWGMPGDHKVVAGTLWSDPAASIVSDLSLWIQKYLDDTGTTPALVLISNKVKGYLLHNTEIRYLAASVAGAPNLVTPDMVQMILAAYGLPPFATYDTKIRIGGTLTRLIPENLALLLPDVNEPLGRTFHGVTAEALELQAAGMISDVQSPGVVAVIDKTFDPVATWTKCAALAMPVIANPKLLFTARVLA